MDNELVNKRFLLDEEYVRKVKFLLKAFADDMDALNTFTIQQSADIVGCSHAVVRMWIHRKKILAERRGCHYVIRRSVIESILKNGKPTRPCGKAYTWEFLYQISCTYPTLQAAGDTLGISRERVRQLYKQY